MNTQLNPIPEEIGIKKCKKCGREGEYGHNNQKLNFFSLYRKDKRGQGSFAYENTCKDCRREGIYKKQGYVPKTRRKKLSDGMLTHKKECINLNNPPIEITHSSLKREGESLYRSQCPVCEDGLLLVGRDQNTLELQKNDVCILCGQHFTYADIEEMRQTLG